MASAGASTNRRSSDESTVRRRRRAGSSHRPRGLCSAWWRWGACCPIGVDGSDLLPQRQLPSRNPGRAAPRPVAAAADPGAANSYQPNAHRLGSVGSGDESAARESGSPLDAGRRRRRPGVARLRRPRGLAPAGRGQARDRSPPLVAKLPADFAVTLAAMGRWTNGATRGGFLMLLFLMAAMLPGTGIGGP